MMFADAAMAAPNPANPTTPVEAVEVQPVNAGADAAGTPPAKAPGLFDNMLIPMMLCFGIFYFLFIRPQQRKDKERRRMIENLRAGAKVTFAGGFIGTIVEAKEKTFRIELAPSVVVEVARGAVQDVVTEAAEAK